MTSAHSPSVLCFFFLSFPSLPFLSSFMPLPNPNPNPNPNPTFQRLSNYKFTILFSNLPPCILIHQLNSNLILCYILLSTFLCISIFISIYIPFLFLFLFSFLFSFTHIPTPPPSLLLPFPSLTYIFIFTLPSPAPPRPDSPRKSTKHTIGNGGTEQGEESKLLLLDYRST